MRCLLTFFCLIIHFIASAQEADKMRVQDVKEIKLRHPSTPDTVYASDKYSVADFEIGHEGQLILLTYDKNLQKDAQLQLVKNDTVLAFQALPERANSLIRDFRAQVHVLTDKNAYGLRQINDSLTLVRIPKDYYFKYISPIVDTSYTHYFYSTYLDIYPAFDYACVDQLDSTYKHLLNIQDDLMMELYRSEYKWVDVRTKLWAKNLELRTGVDAEIYVGANYFTQSLYYEPVYAPLFFAKDTIFIFDYPKNVLRTFTSKGDTLATISLSHHLQAKKTGFQKNLQLDRQTGKIYAIYQQEGYSYVAPIDLQTGQVTQKVKLAFRYVDKIRVHDNEVYFIYRPYESAQNKFVYKQKLPF
jgi:hypothetical protein